MLLLLVATAAMARPVLIQPVAAEIPSDVAADFSNDGFVDLAVGAPGENDIAGVVNVLYGALGGLSGTGAQVFGQVGGVAESGDRFGSALAAGDFNNDGFADLAAGASGENVSGAPDAGAVSVLYGSPDGLTRSGGQLFTQPGSDIRTDELFGFALAAVDFNNDGFADLAAGAPREAVGNDFWAGAVSVLPGSSGGLTATGAQFFTQVGGAVEDNDQFGSALAAGNFNNDGFVDLAAGAPLEDVGTLNAAGAVSVLPGSAGGLTTSGGRLFTQAGTGAVEADDQFGSQLAAGDFNDNGVTDLAAAAPTEDVGTSRQAGAVSVLQGSGGGLTTTGGRLFTQNSSGVPGVAETFDLFGGLEVVL